MSRALVLLVAAALLGAACAAPAAEPLGRLFFTPEQRAALDARRKARVPDRPATAIVISPTVRLDGYVKRSSGPSTVWVNGEPVEHKGRIPATSDAPISVSVGDTAGRVEMKPGEVLDRGNGEVTDVIGGGEISIRRPAR